MEPSSQVIPGSRGLPLVGETLSFLSDPVAFVETRAKKYGETFRSHLFGRPVLVMLGEDANRFILRDGMPYLSGKDGWPPTFTELLGDALMLQDGAEHQRHRRLLTPAFHTEVISTYVDIINERLTANLQRWERLHRFAWFDEFHRLSFEVSARLFLGSRLGPERDYLDQLVRDWITGLLAVPVPLPWTRYGRALRSRRRLLAYVGRAIEERKHNTTHALGLLAGYRDEAGNELTAAELRSQALFLVAAGYATTASLLTSMVYALAAYPAVAERARAEQREQQITDPLSLESTKRMVYLDKVLLEVERLFPPASFGFRGVAKAITFKGYTVPPGWQLMYSVDHTHRDERYYPNPNAFDPDRFADGNTARGAFRLIGFGGGQRVCLGMALARTQAKLVASRLLRGYTWELEGGTSYRAKLIPTRQPRDGLRVRFRAL